MKKFLIFLFLLTPGGLLLPGCGGYSSSGSGSKGSGIKYRAFVSNSVTGGASVAGVYIVDAQNDLHPAISPIAAGNTPGMMVVTPNRNQTLVFSGNNSQFSDNSFNVIDNASESNVGHVTLPGFTESFLVSPDSSLAYVALPNAPVIGQSPGKIEIVALTSIVSAGEIDIPAVHYLSINNGGSRLLAFSGSADTTDAPCSAVTPCYMFVVTPSNLGTGNPVVAPIPSNTVNNSLDHPVQAFFSSDDTTAFVVNCGAECGGTQASVQAFDMTSNTPGTPAPVDAASVALLSGSTMYLAGTPYADGAPSQPCTGQQTAATTCGLLTVFDLTSMSVVTSGIVITDGYHNRIAMGANGQLFIGARTCTEIIPPQPPPPGAEIRGCLSVFNTQSVAVGNIQPGQVTIPPENGDVTGIQPIARRDVVYLIQGQNVQGGTLYIYDTTTDAENTVEEQRLRNLVGGFVDVKTVDF